MSTSGPGVFTSFVTVNVANQYDTNRNGLEKKEIAQAALNLRNTNDPTDQKTGSLLATIVAGGKDGAGFFNEIDTDRNGSLSTSEFQRFAGLDGKADSFSTDDVKALSPTRYVEGGVAIDNNKLQQIANGTDPQQPPNQLNQSPLTLLLSILSLFLQFLTQPGNGGNNYGGGYTGGGYPGTGYPGTGYQAI